MQGWTTLESGGKWRPAGPDSGCRHAQVPAAITIAGTMHTIAFSQNDLGLSRESVSLKLGP